MSKVNPTPNDRIRYVLFNKSYGSIQIIEPEGWDSDDKEYSRNDDYDGIFAKFSNSLKFTGDAKEFIELVYQTEGINAALRLTKEERHPRTDVWVQAYYGDLDFSTREIEDNKLSIKFNSGGLEQLLKARESEDVEPARSQTMDGKTMDPLRVDLVDLQGRQIFLDTRFNILPTMNWANITLASDAGNQRQQTTAVPLNLFSNSHENAHSPIDGAHGGDTSGSTGIMFFLSSNQERLLNLSLNLSFLTNVTKYANVGSGEYGLYLTRYAAAPGFVTIERTALWQVDSDDDPFTVLGGAGFGNIMTGAGALPPSSWSVAWNGQITVGEGESLALEFMGDIDFDSGNGHFDCKAQNINGSFRITEDSHSDPSQCKFILAHEVGERLVEIITGDKTAFKSKYLGRTDIGYAADGPAALFGLTHGFWVRGFDGLQIAGYNNDGTPYYETNDNRFKPLTTSFKDFVTSLQTTMNVGLGIERIGYKEKIIIEDRKYFFNRNTTIRLPNQIKNAKRSINTKSYFSGLEFGYEKGGEYEEAQGLDEYNGKASFTTVISRVKNTYSKLSKYRADSYGKEFARRKNITDYPTEDTQYDTDIFLMDLKRGPGGPLGIYEERKWQDDFTQEPTGVYSPETATNLRLSPVNMMLRHGWTIAAGFIKYPLDYVRYGASTANSQLKTQLIGGNEYAENGNILNSELERARYNGETIEFEHVCDFNVMQQVGGSTIIQGAEIPNMYGMVEFINERGELEKGWLDNLKPNDKGKWKILLFNQ